MANISVSYNFTTPESLRVKFGE